MVFYRVKKAAMQLMLFVLFIQSFFSPMATMAETMEINDDKESQLSLEKMELEKNDEESATITSEIIASNLTENEQTFTLTTNLPIELADDTEQKDGIELKAKNKKVEVKVAADTDATKLSLKLNVIKETPEEQTFQMTNDANDTQTKEVVMPSIVTQESSIDSEKTTEEETETSEEASEEDGQTEQTTEESNTELSEASDEEKAEEETLDSSEENIEEEDKAEKAEAFSDNVGPQAELGNIFEFEYFRLDGEDVEDGAEVDFDATYQIQYAWDTEDLDVNAGDTATLELPDVFLNWENTPDQNITLSDGTVVGTYTINDGVLEFTFNENIEGQSIQNGFVGFGLEFNREKFTEEWEQDIDFDHDGQKDLTVVTTPSEIDTSMDKRGELDSQTNATEITWTVDIVNGGENPLANGILTDTLPEGVGNPENFVVRPITYDAEGNDTVGDPLDLSEFSEPNIDDRNFNWNLGEVPERSGYQVEYTTSIEDYEQNSFTNNAEFNHDDGALEAQTTVDGGQRSNPIQKTGEQIYWSDKEDEIGQIRWTITVNEGGSSIDEAIVHDELPEGLSILADSITIDKNGEDITNNFHVTDFPINLGEVNRDEVYTITFVTEIDWSEINEGNYQQENSFTNNTEPE